MRVHVKLNASLREYAKTHSNQGLVPVELEEGATVLEVLRNLGIPPGKVKMVLLNGRGGDSGSPLSDDDRVALFPSEMAFNMYVALSFRRDFGKKGNGQGEP